MTASPTEPSRFAVARLLWSRVIWRHWRAEPRLTAVLVGILALGVAVFLAVRLANKAAVSGFGLFTESIAGESDAILRPRAGDLPADVLVELRDTTGTTPVNMFPVLEVAAAPGDESDSALLRLVGADLVALRNAASGGGSPAPRKQGDEGPQLGRPDLGFVGEKFATRFGVAEGDRFAIAIGGGRHEIEIGGVLPDDPNRAAVPDNLMLLDLPGLQELAGKDDALTRVEFRIPPGADAEASKKAALGALWDLAAERGWLLETPDDRKDSVTTMSAAFRLNLTILSGLALLVGMYLILQAMEAAVVKRRAEIAVLRSLGVKASEIRAAWLFEALVLGVVGAVLGILLGRLLATGLVGAIARTVNTLYYETTSTAVRLESGEIVFCLVFGTVASLLAAWLPAREAATTPPAQTMRQGTQGGGFAMLRNLPLGLVLLAAGIGLAFLEPRTLPTGTVVPIGGYLAAVVLVFAASILIGPLFRIAAVALSGNKAEPMRAYAASQLRRPEGRHRITAAGLAVAIGMSAAMGILVASFENTLTGWIGQLLKADLYVAAPGANSVANDGTVPEDAWQEIAGLPGVAGMDKLRRYTVTSSAGDFFVGGTDYNDDPERYLQLIWLDEPDDTGPHALETKSGDRFPGWVSESLARRFDLAKGSPIALPTPAGVQPIVVDGIYAEYGNETGTLIVARRFTEEWFDDRDVSNLAIYLDPGADPERVREEILVRHPALTVRTNAALREESIRIFHQTFAVTYALEAIAVFIAVAGLGLALAGLLMERRDELATLKSLGARRREIASAAMWEGVGLAAVGLAGGFLLSFLLGWILIFVINPQSFGWTLDYRVPWLSFAGLAALTLAAAAVVARLVGHRGANLRSDRTE